MSCGGSTPLGGSSSQCCGGAVVPPRGDASVAERERKRRKQIGGEMTQTKEAGVKLVGN